MTPGRRHQVVSRGVRRLAEVIGAAESLDEHTPEPPVQPFNLRFAIVHTDRETARHNGHLDLMHQAIDGSTGE